MRVSKSIRLAATPGWTTLSSVKSAAVRPQGSEPEFLQGSEQSIDIAWRRRDPQVDVTGVARMPMSRQRATARDEVINPARAEQFGKLSEVAVQHLRWP